MELLNSLIGIPYVIHGLIVGVVFLGAASLFIFGFKPAEEPPYNKSKNDSKALGKKKKGKEKKSSNGTVSSSESKSKGTPKPKSKSNDEKNKKNNALKDSKNTINTKNARKEQSKNETPKKKGKENVASKQDFVDEDVDGWVRAGSKKKRNTPNGPVKGEKGTENKQSSKGSGDTKSPKNATKKTKENVKPENIAKQEKQKRENSGSKRGANDPGAWQEAKSSKKRRKVQKEA